MTHLIPLVGSGDAALDERLSDELDKHNAAATKGTAAAEELTVRIQDGGDLVAGVSGWTWGQAAGIAMMWVDQKRRTAGLGTSLLREFEAEAKRRGCTHVFTTSFSFQAPEFYEKAGYVEIFRWEGVPNPGQDDVHMRKQLL